MSQIITTTDISTIRPMFANGAGENIKRYGQLKKLFEENKEYLVLAEPVTAGGNKIAWHTDFEGHITTFDQQDAGGQEIAKGRLKFHINKLYKTALKYSKNKSEDVKDLFGVLDTCIEIPDYQDIYIIQNTEGHKDYVIIRWGFTSDDFNAKTGLIKKLIPLKVSDVILRTAFSNDKPSGNQVVEVVFAGKKQTFTSDKAGKIIFQDVPLFTAFSAFQYDEKGQKSNEHEYVCDERDEYFFHVGAPIQDITIYVTDKFGNYIPNTSVTFEYLGQTKTYITDSFAKIQLDKIDVGTEIRCSQEGGNKQQITVKDGQREYRIIGTPPIADMKFAVVDSVGLPIKNTSIIFEYESFKIERISDDNGNITLNNMPLGIEVKCSQPVGGEMKHIHFFNCKKDVSEYRIEAEKPILSGNMNFKLINQFENVIPDCQVCFEYADQKIEKTTNSDGFIIIENVPFGTTVKVSQLIKGKPLRTISYTSIQNKSEYLVRGEIKIAEERKPEILQSIEFKIVNHHNDLLKGIDFAVEMNSNRSLYKTDGEGKVIISGIKTGTKAVTNVYFEGKNYLNEYVIKETDKNFIIEVGIKKRGIWFWLLPLLLVLLLILFGLYLLRPYISSLFVATKTNTVKVTDTVKIHDKTLVIPPNAQGLIVTVQDRDTKKPIPLAVVKLDIDGKQFTGTADKNGEIYFAEITKTDKNINAEIQAATYNSNKTVFIFEKNKILYIDHSDKTQDISEIPMPCGLEVSSGGFGTTIKVYNLKSPKGGFNVYYNMYQIPDAMQIFVGKPSQMSPDKMLWSTNGPVQWQKSVYVTYESPDSLITVKVTGTDNKTTWIYKIFCPK
jgi:hypothetical protein